MHFVHEPGFSEDICESNSGCPTWGNLGGSRFQKHVLGHTFLFSSVTTAAFSKLLLCCKQ